MKFSDLLGEFSAKTGLENLGPEEDGSVTLLFDDLHEVTFTPDGDDGSLLMHCEMGDADGLEKADLLRLLRVSLLGAETGGASFAVHESLGKIVLWKRFDDRFEDLADLERRINGFLAQIIRWKKLLEEHAPGLEPAFSVADSYMGSSPMNMMV